MNDVVDSLVEVRLPTPDSFLKIKETLTRIGVTGKDKTLWQSCHILFKGDKYYIVHFKEMFLLDGRNKPVPHEDIQRRNTICKLLEEWGLCEIVDHSKVEDSLPVRCVKILRYDEAKDWNLRAKYTIGRKK